MPQYKVALESIDRQDETKDINFSTFVVADSSDEAIEKAKVIQKTEKDINPADTWFWSAYETAEEHE